VDAGGWFRSKYFLLPMQNALLNSEQRSVVADLSRENVDEFPGFDKSEFKELSDAELQQIIGFRTH
jgi:bacteriocin-like protein